MTKSKSIAISRALAIVRKHFPKVTKVNDATGPVTVEVTGRDVSSSKRRKHAECALAVTCKRALNLSGVIISVKTAYLIKGDTATRYTVPERISREVVSFDRGSSFEPGDYTLRKPDHKMGAGAHSPTQKGGSTISKAHVLTKNIRAVLGSKEDI